MDKNIVLGDSREAKNYPKGEIHLTVTSPPYFVGKEYEKDYTFQDYKDLLKEVLHNTAACTAPGGKIAINISDIAAFSKVSGRIEENIEISRLMVDWMKKDDCHLLSRIAWVKDPPWVNSQFVSFNPKIPATYVRMLPTWEYIWVYYKGDTPKREGLPPITSVVDKSDWKRWVTGVWNIPSVHANKEHEAMFPEELARRLILLYSVPGDVVFDPFMGSGTAAVVAHKNGRKYAGIERDEKYYDLILKSLEAVENSCEVAFRPPEIYKQNKVW